jgi:hypothetical protein
VPLPFAIENSPEALPGGWNRFVAGVRANGRMR